MITNFKKRAHREFASKIDESRARFETMAEQQDQRVKSKEGDPIREGDHVWTKMRGGRREGDVERIVASKEEQEEAQEPDVKNPPKVIFTDQHGHRVAHNPGTLEKTE